MCMRYICIYISIYIFPHMACLWGSYSFVHRTRLLGSTSISILGFLGGEPESPPSRLLHKPSQSARFLKAK